MISSPSRARRNVVPRWRSLSSTIESQELSYSTAKSVVDAPTKSPPEFLERLAHWKSTPSIVTAAELTETSIVYGKENEHEVINAARFLCKLQSNATILVRRHAALILKRTGHSADVPVDLLAGQADTAGLWRSRTRLHPHNALAWVELALAQVSRGHSGHALKCMQVALQLAPHNRHVIRSASRLYLHVDEPDKAYSIVRKNETTPYDPWLMAAEIALAPIADKKPAYMKRGLAILDDKDQLPRQISELCGAIGTTVLVDGNRNKAKKLFQQSMLDPTGNSLAQAQWVSQKYDEEWVKEPQLNISGDAKEAKAFHFYNNGDFNKSLESAKLWITEEQFSGRPYKLASAVATVIDENELAIELTKEGLLREPDSLSLINNRIYALACTGHLPEAEELLSKIPEQDVTMTNVAEANRGLIALRRGQIEQGMHHYHRAIEGFREQKSLFLEQLAFAYYAKESARINIDAAPDIFAEAEKRNNGTHKDHAVTHTLNVAKAFLGTRAV